MILKDIYINDLTIELLDNTCLSIDINNKMITINVKDCRVQKDESNNICQEYVPFEDFNKTIALFSFSRMSSKITDKAIEFYNITIKNKIEIANIIKNNKINDLKTIYGL